ncbi:MAG: Transporter [Ignavibacteriae bacterium]|nr:MAG: Transporter [Ignavibacteriota bacterium]
MEADKKGILTIFRNSFMRGIAIIVPIVITILVLRTLFEAIDGIISPLTDELLGYHIPGVGFITMLLLILIVGLMSRNLIGRFVIKFFDKLISTLPLARTIYSAIRDLIDAFAISAKSKTFKNVVMVEYPRVGLYSVGFATNEVLMNIDGQNNTNLVSVYFPHPPNPTSGVVIFVPRDQIKVLNLTIEEGLKLVLSGGVVSKNEIKIK